MTLGVGGSTAEKELAAMSDRTTEVEPISVEEYQGRIAQVQAQMAEQGVDALYLDSSTNLKYFAGFQIPLTERLIGAVLPVDGPITYVAPAFEVPKVQTMLKHGDQVRGWHEHEDPTALVIDTIGQLGYEKGVVAIDPQAPFFSFDGIRRAGNRYDFTNGAAVITPCRARKSKAEIAIMQAAHSITIEVQRAAARILYEGMTTTELQAFAQEAHRRLGATILPGPPLILFGEASAYPHGVPYPQTLKSGDMVLLDLGAYVGGYRSDITRSYVFGEPSQRQREVWDLEKAAQSAGFTAAQLGDPCENVDAAARAVVESGGFGTDYALPGLPHRTGHGIGLDVHEEVYMVRGNKTPLAEGMCFSIEPTICIYGEFGLRLEDCAYITADGPRWFTEQAHSVDDPFGYDA